MALFYMRPTAAASEKAIIRCLESQSNSALLRSIRHSRKGRAIGAPLHPPPQPITHTLPHDQRLVRLRQERHLLGEQRHRLAVGAGEARDVGAPEDALRAEGLDDALHMRVEVAERVRLGREAGQRGRLDRDVGALGERIERVEPREGLRVAHAQRARDRQVVDDELEAGVALGDAVDLGQQAGRRDHQRDAGLLGRRPEPVEPPLGQHLLEARRAEGDADAEHAGLLLPVRQARGVRRIAMVEPAHHREAVGPASRRVERQVVALALPGRRHDDRAVDAGLIHAEDQRVGRQRLRAVLAPEAVRRPRPRRRTVRPDMDLRVDDEHAGLLLAMSA